MKIRNIFIFSGLSLVVIVILIFGNSGQFFQGNLSRIKLLNNTKLLDSTSQNRVPLRETLVPVKELNVESMPFEMPVLELAPFKMPVLELAPIEKPILSAPILLQPANMIALYASNPKMAFMWMPSSGAVRYDLMVRFGGSSSFKIYPNISDDYFVVPALDFPILEQDYTHHWKVRAYDLNNNFVDSLEYVFYVNKSFNCQDYQTNVGNNKCVDKNPKPLHTVDEALSSLFGITFGTKLPAMESYSKEAIINQYSQFFDHTVSRTLTVIGGENVNVVVSIPDDSVEKVALANSGIDIIERMMPYYVNWFGAYPYSNLYIRAFADQANFQGGFLNIGGNAGLNSWALLGHEFTHSYFSSLMGYSWFAEGSAQFLPYVSQNQMYVEGKISAKEVFGDYSSFNFTFLDFLTNRGDILRVGGYGKALWSLKQMLSNGLAADTTICSVDNDYLKGAIIGEAWLLDAYINMGQDNFLSAMATLSKNYRITKKSNTYSDIYKTFAYFTPIDKQDFLNMSKKKLCQV